MTEIEETIKEFTRCLGEVEAAILQAHADPLTTAEIMAAMSFDPPRKPANHAQQVMLPRGHRLAISIEEQAMGLVAHISMDHNGQLPHPVLMAHVAVMCKADPANTKAWTEPFFDLGEFAGHAYHLAWLLRREIEIDWSTGKETRR